MSERLVKLTGTRCRRPRPNTLRALSARTRVFTAGLGRKTDATDAHAIALAATRMTGLRPVTDDARLEVLRVLANRRRALGEDHMPRSLGLAGLVVLGEQVTLRSRQGGLVAAAAAQDEGDADGEHGAGDRPGDVDPVAGEGPAGQVGPEGTGRVHRGA